MFKTNNLAEFSSSYYEESYIYKKFSDAEDKEMLIFNTIKYFFNNKSVLDLGCGNGRFLDPISSIASYSVGIDQSIQQISQNKNKLNFICGDISSLPFSNESFDCIISSFVLGTILDINKRVNAINEAKRVLKKQGLFILVENAPNCEFNSLRGRHLNTKTEDYNDWLLSQEFKPISSIETFITFDSIEESQFVFKSIWKDKLFNLPSSNKIKNKVIVFSYQKPS